MVVNNAIAHLVELGFTEYEAKAYIALISSYPATSYEIAKRSGIPTSKIYQVMDRLVQKDIAQAADDSDPKRFVPMEPDEYLSTHRERIGSVIDTLSAELATLKTEASASYVWNIHDYEGFIEKARRSICESSQTLLLSLWPQEAGILSTVLAEATKRGVKGAAVVFGEHEIRVSATYHHPIEDTLYAEKGGRGFVLIADGAEAIMGTIHSDGGVDGTWSRSPGFVTLAEDYVKHDVYIMKIVRRFDDELIRTFGSNYELLRDVFHDKELTQ